MGLRACLTALSTGFLLLLAAPLSAQAPHFAPGKLRPALIVDGEPFLVLGAQANNS